MWRTTGRLVSGLGAIFLLGWESRRGGGEYFVGIWLDGLLFLSSRLLTSHATIYMCQAGTRLEKRGLADLLGFKSSGFSRVSSKPLLRLTSDIKLRSPKLPSNKAALLVTSVRGLAAAQSSLQSPGRMSGTKIGITGRITWHSEDW